VPNRRNGLVRGERLTAPGTFIDLFAGCGGLSLGLMESGWRGLFAIERDGFAFDTLHANLLDANKPVGYEWPNWLPQEPHEVGRFIAEYREEIRALQGQVTLIAGGPPCQGFSFAGKRSHDDPRNDMFSHYVEFVNLVRPDYLLVENVQGITVAFGKKQSSVHKAGKPSQRAAFSQAIKDTLDEIGYEVYADTIRAADYGVAQARPRYIAIGIRRDVLGERIIEPFEELKAIRDSFLKCKGLPTDRPISVKEAISDLEIGGRQTVPCYDSPGFKQMLYRGPRTDYQRMLHGTRDFTPPNSLRLANHTPAVSRRFRIMLDTCRRGVKLSPEEKEILGLRKHSIYVLDENKPAHTLTTLPDDVLHYSEPRILTVREYARLQSFPDWYQFRGKYTTGGDKRVRECPRYTQVGNAVAPLMAEVLGSLLQHLRVDLPQSPAAASTDKPLTATLPPIRTQDVLRAGAAVSGR